MSEFIKGEVTCVHNMWPSGIISGAYFIKSSVEVKDEANSSGRMITLIFFEPNELEIITTSGSLVDTTILSISSHFISWSNLILQRTDAFIKCGGLKILKKVLLLH